MSSTPHAFKRLVLGFHPNAPERTLPLAIELADLLHLDLLGLFLEDPSLRHLAGMPFAREFQPLTGWRPIEIETLAREADLAARAVERTFTAAARKLLTRARFEVMRAPIAEAIASVSCAGDIVVVIEPESAAARTTQQFTWLIEAALHSAAAVLLVPPHAVLRRGPVVAIVTETHDPSLQIAASIARAASEDLIVVDACGSAGTAPATHVEGLANAGVRVAQMSAAESPWLGSTASPPRHHLRERLVVVTRGAVPTDRIMAFAAARHVPVLVLEPADGPLRSETL